MQTLKTSAKNINNHILSKKTEKQKLYIASLSWRNIYIYRKNWEEIALIFIEITTVRQNIGDSSSYLYFSSKYKWINEYVLLLLLEIKLLSKVKKDQLLHQDPESYSKSSLRLAIRKSLSPLILTGEGIATLLKQSASRVLSRAINWPLKRKWVKLRKLELDAPTEWPNAALKNQRHMYYTFWCGHFLFHLIVNISSDCNFTATF